jgi:Family of unknown function (DUF6049)
VVGIAAALLLAWMVPPAGAQDQAPVRLTLVTQSVYAAPGRPLHLRVAATNQTEEALGGLALKLWVYPSARSRSEFDEALRFDTVSPLHVSTFAVPGALEPGATRRLPAIEARLPILGDLAVHALYPIKIELTSENLTLAELRSTMVGLYEMDAKDRPARILLPLDVSLTFVLDAPPAFRPDGAFVDDSLIQRIAPDGPLGTIADALADTPVRCTLAVSPLLLEQLRRMADGFRLVQGGTIETFGPDSPEARRAAEVLEEIRVAARSPTEVVALPYASPSVPAMAAAGLRESFRAQISRGRRVVEDVLGVPLVPEAFRPPGGSVDQEALDLLLEQGERSLILDSEAVGHPTFFLTPPPVALLQTEDGGEVRAITPDAGVDRRIESEGPDARLTAMRTLGELSAIYFEQPGTARATAIVIGEDDAPRPPFLRTLLRGLAGQLVRLRWLRPVSATRLLTAAQGDGDGSVRRRLRPLPAETFSSTYLEQLRLARRGLSRFADVAGLGHEIVNRLGTLVLTSQSRYLMSREDEAVAMLETVERRVTAELAKITPPPPTTIRLTSRSGFIPVTLHNEAGYDVVVRVELRAPGLDFVGGASRRVRLSRPEQQLTFPVEVQRTGRFQVAVEIQTPEGEPIAESSIVVRSTAYNRVALVVTIGAAVFLALWWSRRFLPRVRP